MFLKSFNVNQIHKSIGDEDTPKNVSKSTDISNYSLSSEMMLRQL